MTFLGNTSRWLRASVVGVMVLGLAVGCGGSDATPTTPDGAPPITVSPNPFTFPGQTLVGAESAAQVFTVQNDSQATLTRVGVGLSGVDFGDFRLGNSNCGTTLPRGMSCMVQVSFMPKTAGPKTATLVVNAHGGQKTIELKGTAARPAALSITPADHSFGAITVGTQSMARAFVVKNEGTQASAAAPTIMSNSPEFPIVENGCSGALEGGATCMVSVAFAPTASGGRTGTISAGLEGTTAATATLTGTGQAMPRLSTVQSEVVFPPQAVGASSTPVTVTVTNGTTSTLTGITHTPSTDDFQVGASTCGMGLAPGQSCTVQVTFMPRTAGALKADLIFAVMGGVGTQVALSGTGLRRAALTLAPPSHTFPPTAVDETSGAVTFTLKNDGQQDAGSLTAALTGADKDEFVLVNNCGPTLRGDATCTLTVSYKPTNEGASNATLSISGTPGGTISATLSGTGVGKAAITITPNVDDFGSVAVNASSPARNFKIRNTGGVASGMLAVSVVGTEFSIPGNSNGCLVNLAPNVECTLSVIFSPSSAGARSSTLTVISPNAGTTGASLTGTGVAQPILAITPPMGNFGSVGTGGMSSELTFTVSNTGGSTAGVVTVTSGSSQFQITTNGCANKALAVGETCAVGVRFAPSAVGDFSNTLTATASPGGSATAALTGVGTSPPSLVFRDSPGSMTAKSVHAFGMRDVGTTSGEVEVFLQNTGSTTTGMLATTIAGTNASDFEVVEGSNNCGAPLAPSATCSLRLTFRPGAAGARSGVLNIMSATGGVGSLLLSGEGVALLQIRRSGAQVTSYDFGEQTVGQTTGPVVFTIFAQAASGTYTVTFDGGGSPPSFAMGAHTCTGTPLAANGTCDIPITFQPQFPLGAKTGTLTVTTSSGVTASVTLRGTATGPLVFTPSPHNFGPLASGSTAEQVFTLRNNAPQPMTAVSIGLTGDDFSVVGDTCVSAPPANGGMCTVTVRFVPTTAGAKMATLTATGSYTVAGETRMETATVAISGSATGAAAISVSPATQSFGEVAVGSAAVTRTFTVSNASGVPTSGGITRVISAGDFSLTRNGCVLADNTTPRALAAGESCTFDVAFNPSATGSRSGTLTVSASPGGTITVPLSGTGLSSLGLSAASYDLDRSDSGAAVENVLAQVNPKRVVTVTNRSTAAITLTASFVASSATGATPDGPTYFNVAPDATVGATPCGASLAAGASCTYQLQMVTPMGGTAGTKRAVFQVTGPAATSAATAEVVGTMLRDAVIEFLDSGNRDFGGVVAGSTSGSHTIQLRNTGGVRTGPLQMFDLTNGFTRLPATGTNAVTGNPICTLGQQLAPNQTCDILLQFAPTTTGMLMTTLKVYVTGPGEASAGVSNTNNVRTLTGVGLAPASAPLTPNPVDFGSAPAGTPTAVDRTVKLTNLTGGPLVLAPGDVSVAGAGYSVVAGSTCIGVIAGGIECNVTVRFQPAMGATQGPALGTLSVGSSRAALVANVTRTPTLTIVPPDQGADWGEAPVGSPAAKRTFLIRNDGDGPTGGAPTLTIGGAMMSDYVIAMGDNGCTAAIPAGATCPVAITLTPAGVGTRTATLSATEAGSVAATPATLTANGVLPNAIQIVSIGGTAGSSTTVSFGSKAVASETSIDVVIKNADNAQKVVAPTFTLGDTTNFRYDTAPSGVANNCSAEIADGGGLEGGESCTVRIYFRPQSLPTGAAPNMTTTLVVGGAATTLTLNLQGNAISALSISPATQAFPATAVNATSAPVTFTITNSSDANIGTTGQIAIARTGTDAASFRVIADMCTGNTLAAGASCTVQVVFEPKSAGAKSATLSITAPSTNGASAALSGTGS